MFTTMVDHINVANLMFSVIYRIVKFQLCNFNFNTYYANMLEVKIAATSKCCYIN